MTLSEFEKEWFDSENHITAWSSGSTGLPKAIRLSKDDMIKSAKATVDFFKLPKGATFVCPMDFKYIGAKMMLVRSIVAEGTLIAFPPSNVFKIQQDTDLLSIVPSQVDCLVNDRENNPQKIKNIIIGGSELSRERARALLRAGYNAYVTYGMTETASHIALAKIGENYYRPLPGIDLSQDKRECLVIDMPGREISHVVTNDIVEFGLDGSFRFLGRIDNVINSGGVKIRPEQLEKEIEAILDGFDFERVAVTSRPSEKWGEEVVCVLESPNQVSSLILDDIDVRLREQIANPYHRPKKLIVTDRIPVNGNNKIDRALLKKSFSQKN